MPETTEELQGSYLNISKAVRRLNLEQKNMVALSDAAGDPNLPIQSGVESAIKALFEFAAMPHDSFEQHIEVFRLMLAIDRVKEEWDRWVQWHQESGQNPDGTDSLWSAINDLHQINDNELSKPGDSPHVHFSRGVSERQIAKIMEWRTVDDWDIAKVQRELAKPGSEWTESYVPPSHQAKLDEITRQFVKRFSKPANDPSENGRPQPVETMEDLIFQGLNIKQIKKHYPDASTSHIIDVAEGLGVDLPDAMNLASVRAERIKERIAQTEKDQEERTAAMKLAHEAESIDSLNTMAEKIIWMHKEGHKPKQISEALKMEFPELSHQKVARMVRDYKQASNSPA